MMTRRRWHFSALAAAALIVAGCGGGTTDSPLATRVVVFGDSLSDLGTYAPATSINGPGTGAPFFGGKWTTNTHTGYTAANNTNNANIWVEWIAARLGVTMTQAEIGFATTRIQCPAAARGFSVNTCTGYAQGGSRVTDPNGNGRRSGALTIPLAEQIAMHNARSTSVGTATPVPGFRDGFGDGDIVFVFGGGMDVLIQFETFLQSQPTSTPLTPASAVANVRTAATELAALVKDEIIAKGGKRVTVMTLPDIGAMPVGAGVELQAGASARAFLSQLSAEFNSALLDGLSGSAARIFSVEALFASVRANPSAFGLTNITAPACAPTAFNTTGTALLCNVSPAALFARDSVPNFNALAPGASASTYLWADSTVHPTTGGHKVIADQVWAALKDFGWVPDNL